MRIDAELDLLACFFPYQFRYASYSCVNFQTKFVRPLDLSNFVMLSFLLNLTSCDCAIHIVAICFLSSFWFIRAFYF